MRYIIFTAFMFLASLGATQSKTNIPQYVQGDLSVLKDFPKTYMLTAENDVYWCLFISNYFGFYELWAANSVDGKNWSQALYTGIPLFPRKNITASVTKPYFIVEYDSVEKQLPYLDYLRSGVNQQASLFKVTKSALLSDSDLDGWSDLAESRIWTDMQNTDTDGDGKIDRYDNNPLAASPDSLSLAQKLHKHIIEKELGFYETHQLVIVEQTQGPMQYERKSGLILSLVPEECDEWVHINGPGVPIFTCRIHASEKKDHFEAEFEFWVAKNDAWGYEAEYRWHERFKFWRETRRRDWFARP